MIALGVSALPFDDPAGFTAPAAFGPFRVLHQIGSGVLGPVFRTFDPKQEKLVAVKVFRLDVVPEVSARLADILKRLSASPVDHPAVVPLVDAGLEGTTAFLAMEYVAAETLDVALRRLAPAGIETAEPILRQIAEAIEAAWAAGVGHGALHPRDIFVLPAIAEGAHDGVEIRVSGFGVTEALQELRIATPVRHPYTAPERDHPGGWDMRADVYSLGVIAHELLTGRRPTSSLEHDGDERIRRVLSGAMAADPKVRFDTPMAFVDALTTGALRDGTAVTPALPWSIEPDAVASSADESEAELPFGAEPETEAEVVSEVRPEPQSIWTPGPEAEQKPARPGGALPAFQPFIEEPKESAMPRILGVAVIALVVGTGFGYWLRGPVPAPAPPAATDVSVPLTVTKVPPDEPIGTDVKVNDSPKAGPTTPPKPVGQPVATPRPARPAPVKSAVASGATTGTVSVETRPAGATVSIDGKVLGTAPFRTVLSPGSHTIRVSLAGHKTVTTTVVVRAGRLTPVRVSLEIQ